MSANGSDRVNVDWSEYRRIQMHMFNRNKSKSKSLKDKKKPKEKSDGISSAQWSYIRSLELQTGMKFRGKTKESASKFIELCRHKLKK